MAGANGALSPEEGKKAALQVGDLVVRLMNDSHFSALRTALGYDAWLPEAVKAFDWGRMAAGGGKGGDKMARTPCKRLFIKEVSGGDLATLTNPEFLKVCARACARGVSSPRCSLQLARAARGSLRAEPVCAAQAYVARVSTGSSLIVHILAHFARPDGQTCLIMNNWLPVRARAHAAHRLVSHIRASRCCRARAHT